MSELDRINGEESPFEAGRMPCPQGGEDRWSARWLMEQMGYDRWENFEKVIERAKQAAHNQGFNVRTLFRDGTKKTGGRPQVEYLLTRFAAYLTAQNGDPRKPEVSAAQVYFAVKTREAETAPAIPDIRTVEGVAAMAAMFNDTAQKLVAAESEKKMLTAAIERDAPLVAKAEAHTANAKSINRQSFAREVQQWGTKLNINVLHEQVYELLRRKGMLIDGHRADRNHATSRAVKSGWAFTHKDVTEDGYPTAVTMINPRGQDIAWKWITDYVRQAGNLVLPPKITGGAA